jgi:hypothetical protein
MPPGRPEDSTPLKKDLSITPLRVGPSGTYMRSFLICIPPSGVEHVSFLRKKLNISNQVHETARSHFREEALSPVYTHIPETVFF